VAVADLTLPGTRGTRMIGTSTGFVVTTVFLVTVAPGASRSR
jgi:hypothetical protein